MSYPFKSPELKNIRCPKVASANRTRTYCAFAISKWSNHRITYGQTRHLGADLFDDANKLVPPSARLIAGADPAIGPEI